MLAEAERWHKAREAPDLEPVFVRIEKPAGVTVAVQGSLDGRPISRRNKGIVRHDVVFGLPAYEIQPREWDLFIERLDALVVLTKKWRAAAVWEAKTERERLGFQARFRAESKKKDKDQARFIREYGHVAKALWTVVPGEVPFFNPVYFSRKDSKRFWRLVDLVRELYMLDEPGETRGGISAFKRQDYLDIASLHLSGLGDVKLARAKLGDDGEASLKKITRARVAMGLRRSTK